MNSIFNAFLNKIIGLDKINHIIDLDLGHSSCTITLQGASLCQYIIYINNLSHLSDGSLPRKTIHVLLERASRT